MKFQFQRKPREGRSCDGTLRETKKNESGSRRERWKSESRGSEGRGDKGRNKSLSTKILSLG